MLPSVKLIVILVKSGNYYPGTASTRALTIENDNLMCNPTHLNASIGHSYNDHYCIFRFRCHVSIVTRYEFSHEPKEKRPAIAGRRMPAELSLGQMIGLSTGDTDLRSYSIPYLRHLRIFSLLSLQIV